MIFSHIKLFSFREPLAFVASNFCFRMEPGVVIQLGDVQCVAVTLTDCIIAGMSRCRVVLYKVASEKGI